MVESLPRLPPGRLGSVRKGIPTLPRAADRAFDSATGFMSSMDVPETGRVLSEAHRVLKPGGFLWRDLRGGEGDRAGTMRRAGPRRRPTALPGR